MNTQEIWKSIPGYGGFYEASSFGKIRSTRRPSKTTSGMYQALSNNGRMVVSLQDIDGKEKKKQVHRLVLLAFKGECPTGMEGCHNDGNPLNNCESNLRWDTPKANAADKRKHGTVRIGERHQLSKFVGGDILRIHDLRACGEKLTDIGKWFGVSKSFVSNVTVGKSWSHLGIRARRRYKNWKWAKNKVSGGSITVKK